MLTIGREDLLSASRFRRTSRLFSCVWATLNSGLKGCPLPECQLRNLPRHFQLGCQRLIPFYLEPRIHSCIIQGRRLQGRLIFFCRFFHTLELMDNEQGQTLVVQNENLDLVVTLRNPYVFDLELQTLTVRLVAYYQRFCQKLTNSP